MKDPYARIRHLPHHVSRTHPQMPRAQRAAQFSAFSALSGYDERIHALLEKDAQAQAAKEAETPIWWCDDDDVPSPEEF